MIGRRNYEYTLTGDETEAEVGMTTGDSGWLVSKGGKVRVYDAIVIIYQL